MDVLPLTKLGNTDGVLFRHVRFVVLGVRESSKKSLADNWLDLEVRS